MPDGERSETMRKFDIKRLPKDVSDKIDDIVWNDGDFDEDVLGQVWLKEGWVFFDDYSHVTTFENKADLISIVRYETRRE